MNKLKPEDVMKALELCIASRPKCKDCPYFIGGIRCKHSKLLRDALALIRENDSLIEALAKNNADLENELAETHDLCEEKDAEIERLRAELAEAEAEAEKAIDIAEGNIRAEIASCGTSCHWCEEKVRADTVRRMHSEIKERCIKGGIYPAFVARTIDQIAKERLEGE